MSFAPFVHLRLHTAYSLLEGAVRVSECPKICRAYGTPALAITDTNNLFGALEFSETLAEEGIQPIMGITLAVDLMEDAQKDGRSVSRFPSIALYAKDAEGWRNLMALASIAHLDAPDGAPPHVVWSQLETHAAGLIALTGGPSGPLDALARRGRDVQARSLLDRLRNIYIDRLYVEIQRHGAAIERQAEPILIDLAFDLDLPMVATNEPYFPNRSMHAAHDALICISEGTYVGEEKRRRLTDQHYLKSPDEMAALFADLPEAIETTIEIAQRCAYRPVPSKPLLPSFPMAESRSEAEELRAQARAGLDARLEDNPVCADRADYDARLDHELTIIERMGFPGYFLIVADFIQWAKKRDIPVGPGRGSGAGSLVAWSLKITDLDPLRFNLLFERFLNPERVSMPDFDVDFCQERRDEVITYVQEKYGRDRVAQIITFGKLQARAVVRDVGRVLQMPYGQVDKLAKLIPANPANPVTLKEAMVQEPRLADAKKDPEDGESVTRLLEIAQQLEGLYRHASTHAAGVVIADRPLGELTPLYRDPRSDMPVTQFNMKWVEPAGLVKFDFLGLKTLTVIAKAKALIARKGVEVDLDRLPFDDPKTFDLLQSGATAGVFQLESAGMRDALRGMKPDKFEDIIALVSLYRPGPMDNIPTYNARKHGNEAPDYLHPLLEETLKETYGVIIYQEQVMQIAQIMAGYSLGEADLLRRAMGKKKKEEMDRQKVRFLNGAQEREVPKAKAAAIFELVAKFAGYGFNKSHAAAYALIAYQTAWLKANWPMEFLAASMTLDMGSADKINAFRQEVSRMGGDLLAPDVNRSEAEFAVRPEGVDFALAAIRNVGRGLVEALVAERRAHGPFEDLFDFAGRMDPKHLNKRAIESLAQAGAFDTLQPNRRLVFESAGLLVAFAQQAAEERESAQENLFGEKTVEVAKPPLAEVGEDWPQLDKLAREAQAVGFYVSGHPLDAYQAALSGRGVVWIDAARRLATEEGRAVIQTAAVVRARQDRIGRRGSPFAFVSLSDPAGEYEAAVYSDVLTKIRDLLEPGETLVLTLNAELRDGDLRWTIKAAESADAAAEEAKHDIRIYLRDHAGILALQRLLDETRGARKGGAVQIAVLDPMFARDVSVRLPGRYALDGKRRAALRSLPGVVDVREGEPA